MLRAAVGRKFEIIGEALSKLSKADSAIVSHIGGFSNSSSSGSPDQSEYLPFPRRWKSTASRRMSRQVIQPAGDGGLARVHDRGQGFLFGSTFARYAASNDWHLE